MTKVDSSTSNEVVHIDWELVTWCPAVSEVSYLTEAILRPTSVTSIHFSISTLVYPGTHVITSLADVNDRNSFELSEEDHIFVTVISEHSSPGPRREMGLDSRHQDPSVVHLCVLAVHRDWDWEPDTTFWRSIRTRGTLDKCQLPTGHVSSLITSTHRVRSE